ncbi:MAG: hypothetical protein ACLTDX_18130 [[Clostridium] innocuum]
MMLLVRVSACGVCGSDLPRILTQGTYHFPTIPGPGYYAGAGKTGNSSISGTNQCSTCGINTGVNFGDDVVVFGLGAIGFCSTMGKGIWGSPCIRRRSGSKKVEITRQQQQITICG